MDTIMFTGIAILAFVFGCIAGSVPRRSKLKISDFSDSELRDALIERRVKAGMQDLQEYRLKTEINSAVKQKLTEARGGE